jgi:hypothetical protein
MTTAAPTKTHDRTNGGRRQVVGLSLDTATAEAFKAEAERRGLSVKGLFTEMWALYAKHRPK